jgi:A/G-specific adenine glycosylase
MLQQTTVATVRKRFWPFVERFPSLQTLAEANETDVLHAWQGLGYYRRARALHACAQVVMRDCGGSLPEDLPGLLALPGIGDYTAKAILAIAFDQPVVPVDGNVMRVLARLFRVETPLPKAAKELRDRAASLEPCPRPADVAQALMDLGATICQPKLPACDSCPWRGDCAAAAAGIAATLPKRLPKPSRPVRQGVAFLLCRPDGAVLFRKRPSEGLLGGLHELPSSPWKQAPIDRMEALKAAPVDASWRFHDGTVRHVFTHFVLELDLAEATTDQPPNGLWQSPDTLDQLALPTVMKKLLRHGGRL